MPFVHIPASCCKFREMDFVRGCFRGCFSLLLLRARAAICLVTAYQHRSFARTPKHSESSLQNQDWFLAPVRITLRVRPIVNTRDCESLTMLRALTDTDQLFALPQFLPDRVHMQAGTILRHLH
jgi:hypothetical protein